MIPQQYKTAFQQQTKLGWKHLFMGKMASGWKHCWPYKKHWLSSIAHTFKEWGRTCWVHRNSKLFGECKDKYKTMRMRLKAEAQVWMDSPNVKTLIPIQQERWKRKLLKKAANSDIAFWRVHNKTQRKLVQRRRVPNIVCLFVCLFVG